MNQLTQTLSVAFARGYATVKKGPQPDGPIICRNTTLRVQPVPKDGGSWEDGACPGASPVVQPRFETGILYVAGLKFQRALPEADPASFVRRITIPVLMLNGRYDYYFPYATSQVPMFELLGTPPEHKEHKVFDGGHNVPRPDLIRETLDWLDRYLGTVN